MKTLILFLMMMGSVTFGYNSNYNVTNTLTSAEISYQILNKIDEFYSFWLNEFRVVATCDVTYQQFKNMFDKYSELNDSEKETVNAYEAGGNDGAGYKVIDVINTLVNKFNSASNTSNGNKEDLDQSTMIGIVSGVAIFGISAILVLYILKNKNIIK